MENPRYKTKRELIRELGLSKSTFYRLMQKKHIPVSPGLLSPKEENELREALGFPPSLTSNDGLGHIGTDRDTLGHIGFIPE